VNPRGRTRVEALGLGAGVPCAATTAGIPITTATSATMTIAATTTRSVTESSGGSQMVWIGGTRYLRQGDGSWQVLHGGPPPVVPSFIWDFFRPFIDARILGRTAVEGVPTRVVTFFGKSGVTPLWFRLWVDREGLVRQAQMRAQGHFMDDRYYDFDQPILIEPPKGVQP